ncbi:MAG: efflux RND transporter periplasmic adaptor subunit [Candidatus Cloacimonetes bacterium]|nr:efflux RND transporter periplasmic adaptor subunit [Candidatus Cloacimonadota bacterium]
MKKILFNLITLAFASLIILTACSKKEEAKSEVEFTGKNYVKVALAEQKNIEEFLLFTGQLQAVQEAYIGSGMSLRIKDILVEEGDIVNESDLLLLMDDAQLKQAEAQFVSAEKDYNRMKALKEKGSISDQAFDQVEAGYKTAKAGYEFLKNNTEIRAPFSGIISAKFKKSGEEFTPMMGGAILKLININELKIKVCISDKDINLIKKGQKAKVSVDTYPDETFIGIVNYVSPEADKMSGTFPCEILIDNKNGRLKPGQYGKVKIIIAERKSAVVLPQNAVVNDNEIFVVENGRAIKRTVILGLQNEGEIEVVKGILAGDTIVISGNVGLKDGALVVIK